MDLNAAITRRRRGARGLRLFTGLLLAIDVWMIVYLFFQLRYNATFAQFMGELPSPFFGVTDRWMDFFNPIRYAWTLDPYSEYWANSPPFMMLAAVALSIPMRLGVPEILVYLGVFAAGLVVIGLLCRAAARHCGMSGLESALLAAAACLSFPFAYCFDRGNFVFFAALAMALGVASYESGPTFLAAFFVGIAAALKLYPAVLGVMFLADRRFREAVFCALTGIVTSVVPLFLFAGGFRRNLSVFLGKSASYSQIGNGALEWLVDDKNSFYQLILVPKMLSDTPLTHISEVPGYVAGWRVFLTVLMAAAVVVCLVLRRNHDRVLLMTMMMLGYPIESGVYNLVIAVFPLVYWCAKEQEDAVIPWLGCGLLMMKSVFVIQQPPVLITWQAVLNPVLELAIIGYIVFLRRRELCGAVAALRPAKKREAAG